MSGTLEAYDMETAVERLGALRIRVIDIRPADSAPAPGAGAAGGGAGTLVRPLRGEEFIAFNEQLAHLARAGLPLEHGLRMVATDLRRGRLAKTVAAVAEELERGTPLGQAFDTHKCRFPALYGRLVEAGVRSGNLAGVLLGLGRYLELTQRLRGTLWRALSYPLMVTVALLIVLVFLGQYVLPGFRTIFDDFNLSLPLPTEILLGLTGAVPVLLGLIVLIVLGGPLLWGALKVSRLDRPAVDRLVLPLPLVGPVVRLSLVARWVDALRLGASAGMDLPAALALAGDATGSPALRDDGRRLTELIEHGHPLGHAPRLRVLPATVPAAIDLAAGHHDLPTTLATLSDMYQRQAEARLASVPAILTPLAMILIAAVIAFVIAGLMLPLISLLDGITSYW